MINAEGVNTIKQYAEWCKASFKEMPNMDVSDWKSAWDPTTRTAFVSGVWIGIDDLGTRRSTQAPFTYILHFNEKAKVDKFTKIWNDAWSARQLGWPDMCKCPSDYPCYDVPLGVKKAT
jgi:hypothetical protein